MVPLLYVNTKRSTHNTEQSACTRDGKNVNFVTVSIGPIVK